MNNKKLVGLLFLGFICILVMGSNFILSGNVNSKIEQKVYDSLNSQKGVRVVIEYKNNSFQKLSSLKNKKSFSVLGTNTSSGEDIVKTVISKEDLKYLEQDNNVLSVKGIGVKQISLQDSVPLINASATWPIKVGGINLTGIGQSICIIDTGVNYSHPNLGGCNVKNTTLVGNQINYVLQSVHPYADNTDITWKINYTGFSNIAVHFVNLSTEEFYDYVQISDSNHNVITNYSGRNLYDIWTPNVLGDTIYVRLVSDDLVNSGGFYIDKIINGTTNVSYSWDGCSKIIGAWDFCAGDEYCYGDEDPDPMDIQGHGTHVAGIAAANGNIHGVAPGANLVFVKASNASGSFFDDVLKNAIDWCTTNSNIYNISVISMSLGGGLYSGYCDNLDDPFDITGSINAAVAKNISVVVAAGNDGSSTQISSPGCIQNVIPVGASTKLDAIASYSNRNPIVQLFAPGSLINSTILSGGYSGNTWSGTSMATPHVAGAIAILNQYFKLKGQTRTPQQIEFLLNTSGKQIHDSSSGLNFSRIDVYSTIASLDDIPVINFTFPSEISGSLLSRNNLLINVSSSSINVKNITITLYNSTMSKNSTTALASNLFYNFSNLSSGIYFFNATVYTVFNNLNFTETRNVTIDAIYPTYLSNLTSGQFNRYTNFTANITLRDNFALGYAWLEGNYTGNMTNSSVYPLSGTETNLSISYNISTSLKSFSYRFWFNDSAGNVNVTLWKNINVVNTPPINSTIIPGMNWTIDSNITLNLSQYFYDVDNDVLNYSNVSVEGGNISVIINQTTAIVKLVPDFGFNGTRYLRFIANDSLNISYSNNITLVVFKPIIILNVTNFDFLTTNFSNLTNFLNVSVILSRNNTGMINFSSVDVNFSNINLDNYVNISSNYIEINSSAVPQLNKSAVLTFYNLSWINPVVYRDGIVCPASVCYQINYSNNTFIFNVTGFSSYTTREASCADGVQNQGETGVDCGGPCSACSSGGSPGGGGGGGGGGGSGAKSYEISINQITNGYTQVLAAGDKILFNISSESHSLTVDKTSDTYVNLAIRSSLVNVTLYFGQEEKFNLTSPNYYDFYVKLNNIINNKANITIKQINEVIETRVENKSENSGSSSNTNTPLLGQEFASNINYPLLILLCLLDILLIIFVIHEIIKLIKISLAKKVVIEEPQLLRKKKKL